MKRNLSSAIILICLLNFSIVNAQSDKIGYAVTDSVMDGVKWNFLRSIDLKTGTYGSVMVKLLSNNELFPPGSGEGICNGVAAIAHDKKNKRVYYTPMRTDELKYVDLKTMRIHTVTNHFTGLMPKASDQSNIITRMVITDNEKGYAITNDGRHLIRFSTRNNPNTTDLGSLLDAPGNGEVSVHNACSSFGGDIIADDEDHLYLVTFRNQVFKIRLNNKVAKYLGKISGLPERFSASGLAVDQTEKKLVLVSSVDTSGVYSVNRNSLVATKLNMATPWYASDLGSSAALKSKNDNNHNSRPDLITELESNNNNSVRIFPNPVTGNEIKIQFYNVKPGKFTVSLMDAKGQQVLVKEVNTSFKEAIVTVNLPELISKGMFIVRVTDKDNKSVYSGKLILQ